MSVTDEMAAGKANATEGQRPADLQAAAMLRNSSSMSFDPSTEMALSAIAAEMNLARLDVIRLALREWLAMRESTRFPTDENAPYGSKAPDRFGP